jgi:ABC-type Fe3+-hydroxamate transport system substrate-binding protein
MVVDALGRTVALAAPPRRVVSLVPSLTEYLFAIGAGDRLVGVTTFCAEPAAQVAPLPKVRGTKNPDRAHIADLRPDVVLASKEENRARDVAALEAAGIPVYVTDICSVAGALDQLGTLAHLLDAQAGAAALLDELRAALDAHTHRPVDAPRWRVLAFIWRDPWMAVGGATYANDLLRLCGADNLALHLARRSKPFSNAILHIFCCPMSPTPSARPTWRRLRLLPRWLLCRRGAWCCAMASC